MNDAQIGGNLSLQRMDNFSEEIKLAVAYSPERLQMFMEKYSNTLATKPYKRILLALYVVILILGTVINILLIHTICKLKNPKSLSNRRMLIIRVICDLALVWFGVPYTAYTAVYRNWVLGSIMCKISAFTIYFIVAMNNFILVAICLNRSVAISQNNKSPTDPTNNVPCRVKCLLAAAVLCALTIALPGGLVSEEGRILLGDTMNEVLQHIPNAAKLIPKMCRDSWSREAQLAYDVILIVMIYLIPLFVVCLSQHIVTVHLKQSQQVLLLMGHQHTLAWTRRRQRLTRLCVLMAALFVLSWSPNHICNLLTKTFHVSHPATEVLLDFSMCLAMSNGVTGAVLLIATCSVYNRYIKRLLSSTFCRRTKDHPFRRVATHRSSISIYSPSSNIQGTSKRVNHEPADIPLNNTFPDCRDYSDTHAG